jgi:hypothetical protein
MAKVDLNNLPSNNISDGFNKPKDDPPFEVEGKVTAKKRKRPGLAQDIYDIGYSLFERVLLPAVKNIVEDFVTSGIRMMLHGEDSIKPASRVGGTNYNKIYNSREPQKLSYRSRERALDMDDFYFERRRDAELVLAGLLEAVAKYQWASVATLHSLVGRSSSPLMDRYGWDDLRTVTVRHSQHGFYINLPEPHYVAQ